jgi:hypothetical protein
MPALQPAQPVEAGIQQESADWMRANGLVIRFHADVVPGAQEQILQGVGAAVRERLIGGELLLGLPEGVEIAAAAQRLRASGVVAFCRPMTLVAVSEAYFTSRRPSSAWIKVA